MIDKEKLQVSIVIINYNTFELTCNCIQSIYDKTKEIEFEIILIDNASTENPPEDFLKRFPKIILIKSKVNLGFSKGNNLGISNSNAEYILLLNSDTVLLNDAISICYQKINTNDSIGIITSKLLSVDGSIQHQCHKFETISLKLIELLRIHKLWSKEKRSEKLLNGYFNHEQEMVVDRIWGTFFMFSKNILKSFPDKKLADRFFMYGEDNEWCYQLDKYTSQHILYWPDAEVEHLIGGSKFNEISNSKKNDVILANKKIYLQDYYGVLKTRLLLLLNRI